MFCQESELKVRQEAYTQQLTVFHLEMCSLLLSLVNHRYFGNGSNLALLEDCGSNQR